MNRIVLKRVIVITIALLMIAIAFVGINESANSNSTNPAASPAVTGSIPNGGTIYISSGPSPAFVDNFNPFNIWTSPAGIMSLMYEPLLQINTFNGTVIPWLATGYSWNTNGSVLTMQLRQNVTFSNGMAFNSSDVVFTFNTQKQLFGEWGFLSSIVAAGMYTVNFTFKYPQIQDLFYIGSNFIIPKLLWQNVSSPNTKVITDPVGTGPYILSKFTPETITLTRNPHFWMPNEPHLNSVVFVDYTSNNALTLGLQQGQVQWTSLFAPNITSLFVSKNPEYNHYYFPQGQPVTLITNDLQYPLNESYFRQALSLGINRTEIQMVGEYGYEQPSNAANILKQQLFWLNSTNSAQSSSLAQYNVSMALSILEAHGFTMANGKLKEPNGNPVPTLSLMTVAGYTDWDADVSIIAQNLKDLGITVSVTTPTNSVVSSDVADGNYTMALYTAAGVGPNPWYDYSGLVGNVTPIGHNALNQNVERWNSTGTGFMGYFNAFNTATTTSEQSSLINHMVSIMLNQMPLIPLVYSANWYEYINSSIGGFVTANNSYWIPMPWYPGPMEVDTLHLYEKNVIAPPVGLSIIDEVGIIAAAVVILGGIAGYSVMRKRKNN